MFRYLLPALTLWVGTTALAHAAPPPAGTQDMVRLWQVLPVTGTTAGPIMTFARFHWASPHWGAMGFYSTTQTGGLRAMARFEPIDGLLATVMGGVRITGLAPLNEAASFREGPELLTLLSHSLAPSLTLTLRGSYAHLWPLAGEAAPSFLSIYGLIASYGLGGGTNLNGGIMGQLQGNYTAGLQSHGVGPFLALVHRY